MAQPEILGTSVIDQDRLLRTILEGTDGEAGAGFFRALVGAVAEALAVRGAWVTELVDDGESLRALAFRLGDDFVEGFRRPIAGTPCEKVIRGCRPVHVPEGVVGAYPADRRLAEADATAYVGVPLPHTGGAAVLGTLAVVHDEPLEIDDRALAVFRFLAGRAAAELRRLRAEGEVRARKEELGLVIGAAMDAVVELDPELRITRANEAAARALRAREDDLERASLRTFLSRASLIRVRGLMDELEEMPPGRQSLRVPRALEGVRADGGAFPAEATLSRSRVPGRERYTLIFRDVSERREAERRLRRLTAETEHLRRALAKAVEGAGIAAPGGRAGPDEDLTHRGALPGEAADAAPARASSSREEGPAPVLTEEEMRAFERENLVRALEASDWQVSGDEGAARLLGIPPSTLSSRMRSLGLERPE